MYTASSLNQQMKLQSLILSYSLVLKVAYNIVFVQFRFFFFFLQIDRYIRVFNFVKKMTNILVEFVVILLSLSISSGKGSSPFWPEPTKYTLGATSLVVDSTFQFVPSSSIKVKITILFYFVALIFFYVVTI